jgi:hypothetical protein
MPNLLALEIIRKANLPHATKVRLLPPSLYRPSQRHVAHGMVKNKIKPLNPYLHHLLHYIPDFIWQIDFLQNKYGNFWKTREFKNQKKHILHLLQLVPNSNKLTNANIRKLIRDVLIRRRKPVVNF